MDKLPPPVTGFTNYSAGMTRAPITGEGRSGVATARAHRSAPHIAGIDGIRGIAIILVALSHGWLLWPTDRLDDHRLLNTPFVSGNAAVSVFFAITGFMAVRALLDDRDSGSRFAIPTRVVLRWARIHAQVFTLLAAVVVWSVVLVPDKYNGYDTSASVFRIATSTWNWYLMSDGMVARSDLGHLWYVSVDLQLVTVLGLLVWVAGRHRAWLAAGLLVAAVLAGVWRAHEFDTQGAYQALLMTTTRMDSMLWGAAAGIAVAWARPLASHLRWMAAAACFLMLPVMVWASDVETYAGLGGFVINGLIVLILLGLTTNDDLPVVSRLLRLRPLRTLGIVSLGLYVWHYPVFWAVSVQFPEWSSPARAVLAVALTGAASEFTRRRVERPLMRRLRR